jgi:hypothetical protein
MIGGPGKFDRDDAGGQASHHEIDRVPPSDVPRDLVREVAASLESLARLLSYDEYAFIVHRIASLRWRCERAKCREAAIGALADARLVGTDDREVSGAAGRVWDAAAIYGKYLELARVHAETVDQAKRARQEAAAGRELVRADRARRAVDVEERTRLREALREYVVRLKRRGDSLDDVLRATGEMLGGLRKRGGLFDEKGILELEVQRIVAEEYVAAA